MHFQGGMSMKQHQQFGFGGLQLLMVAAAIGLVSLVAMPKYNAAMTKAKITEAFNLAGESKRKLSEFYMVNNRFPRSMREADAMKTTTVTPPEYVSEMVVEPESLDHDIVVKVYLNNGVAENPTGVDQFIYIAGDQPSGSSMLEWSCGGIGLDAGLLPENCKG
jgi:Tfp pilus assembly protein PilE